MGKKQKTKNKKKQNKNRSADLQMSSEEEKEPSFIKMERLEPARQDPQQSSRVTNTTPSARRQPELRKGLTSPSFAGSASVPSAAPSSLTSSGSLLLGPDEKEKGTAFQSDGQSTADAVPGGTKDSADAPARAGHGTRASEKSGRTRNADVGAGSVESASKTKR